MFSGGVHRLFPHVSATGLLVNGGGVFVGVLFVGVLGDTATHSHAEGQPLHTVPVRQNIKPQGPVSWLHLPQSVAQYLQVSVD